MDQALATRLRDGLSCFGLPEDDRLEMARLATCERHDPGDVLFRRGEPAARFFVLLEGHVALALESDRSHSIIAQIVHAGETFAEAAICGQDTYPVTAEVLTPSYLAIIPGSHLCELLERRLDAVLQMLSTMSMRLRSLVRQISDLKMKSAAQRLASFLVSTTDARHGFAAVHLPYPKILLAQELGMQPETLSRAFLHLQQFGVTTAQDSGHCHVADIELLRRFCKDQDAEAGRAIAPVHVISLNTLRDAKSASAAPGTTYPAHLAAEDFRTVCETPLLEGLSEHSVADLVHNAIECKYNRDELVFSCDDIAESFFIVITGAVKLYLLDSEGREKIIGIVEKGSSFAEAAVFASSRFPVNCEAMEETRLVKIHRNSFLAKLHDRPSLALHMLASLGRWQLHLMSELWQLKAKSPAQRLAWFLVRLSGSQTDSPTGSVTVRLPCAKGIVAARIGITPESLSRALTRLKALGVTSNGNEITLTNIERVRTFCGN